MSFTDLFIRRPVVTLSICFIILLAGLWAMMNLPLSLYPQVTLPIVQVSTSYPGASPDIIQNYVTNKLQSNLSGIDGVDYVTSQSNQGVSNIQLYFRLGQNLDQAVSTVMRKVQAVTANLPQGVLTPNIESGENDDYYFVLKATSSAPSLEGMTDDLNRMTVPQLELLDGISQVDVWGPTYDMNISLNPQQLLAQKLSAQDIVTALQNYNMPAAPGSTLGLNVSYALNPDTTLHTEDDFNNLVVKNAGVKSIYLKDVGAAIFHNTDERERAYFNGIRGDAIAISVNPEGNPLTVSTELNELLPKLQQHLPGIKLGTVFNITNFIRASLHEVIKAILESLAVVVIVMLLLLGSPRTVAIPLAAIPLSLIGVCFIMWLCHFSFNTLTLLAMVLAIGLVVDDAIVVVENVVRHIENGETALQAAINGAREIASPVIAMTLTLAAVYAPMLMASGITGHLFTEFAMTLAGSVLISGVIALTLSPLLCAKLLNYEALQHPFVLRAEQRVNNLRSRYLTKLSLLLDSRTKIIILWGAIILSCGLLYQLTPHELVPAEDSGILQMAAHAPADANINYLEKYRPAVEKVLNQQDSISNYVVVLHDNTLYSYISLTDWAKRHYSSSAIQANLQSNLNKIAGVEAYVRNISLLPGTDESSSINLVLVGNVDYSVLYAAAKKFEQAAQTSGHFLFVQDDLQYNQPQINLQIDRLAAAAMNILPSSIAKQLTLLLSEGSIQQFAWQGHSYDVKISIPEKFRRNPEDIGNLQIQNQDGQIIPLNNFVHMTMSVVPQTLNQFQKMNSVTITAMPTSSTSFSDALTSLQKIGDEVLNKNIMLDYSGVTRQFMQEGRRTLWTFGMAIMAIFLVLSIQFNRFQDAFIIIFGSVPLAVFGALLPLWLGFGTINIYTQIGLLTLIGLISKHGILLTEFANQAQIEQKITQMDAILQAAKLRFRPIIMTTLTMVVGALPLILATGAGSENRSAIGIVMVFGLGIGTLFTLFVMPVLYLLFGRNSNCHS